MGYTTDFAGSLTFNKPLNNQTKALWNGLVNTRRMKRSLEKLAEKHGISQQEAFEKWGEDGEFYYDENDFDNFGQTNDNTILEYNHAPKNQPGLWLQWIYNEKTNSLEWNKAEKFYDYVDWLEYLINKIFSPRGYVLNGEIEWTGEDSDDTGVITVENNIIKIT